MHFFPRTRNLLVSHKTTQRTFFPTLHPLSLVIFANATVVASVLLHNSRFSFHCYTVWSNTYSDIGPEVTLRPLATSCTKDYKGHSLVQTSFTEPPNSTSVDSKGAEGVNIPIVKIPPPAPPTNLLGRSVAQDRRTRLGFSWQVWSRRAASGGWAGHGHGWCRSGPRSWGGRSWPGCRAWGTWWAGTLLLASAYCGLDLQASKHSTVVWTRKQVFWCGLDLQASKYSSVVWTCKQTFQCGLDQQANIPVWSGLASKYSSVVRTCKQAFQCGPDLQASKHSTVVRTCKQANIPMWSGLASKQIFQCGLDLQASIPVWYRPASKQAFHCGPDLQASIPVLSGPASKQACQCGLDLQASIPVWSRPASKHSSVVQTCKQTFQCGPDLQASIPLWSGPAGIPVLSGPASKQDFQCGLDWQAFQCGPDLQASIPVWSGPASKHVFQWSKSKSPSKSSGAFSDSAACCSQNRCHSAWSIVLWADRSCTVREQSKVVSGQARPKTFTVPKQLVFTLLGSGFITILHTSCAKRLGLRSSHGICCYWKGVHAHARNQAPHPSPLLWCILLVVLPLPDWMQDHNCHMKPTSVKQCEISAHKAYLCEAVWNIST